ncbi:MAG TPA: PKD domain-containing protein [Thermoplasmata archaeon]|nr:PKD domain-containing protein [Thermoplasmata archaeon]
MGEGTITNESDRWRSRRALSTITAAIVMIVVVVVVGAAAYVALGNAGKGGNETKLTCWPPNSQGCAKIASNHDLKVLAPFKTTQTGNPVPFTVIVPTGSASSYSFNFGDGATATSTTPTVDHTYGQPGNYLVQVSASVSGATHDNLKALASITVKASYASLTAGNAPSVGGAIVSNSSASSAATAVLSPGNTVTVSGSYLGAPTNPNFLPVNPRIYSEPNASSQSNSSKSATAITSALTYANPGTYVVTMVGQANGAGPSAGQTAFQDYSWTVIVAPSGVSAGVAGANVASDPHPGTVIYYSTAQGGASSLDPAIAYDTVSYEPILSVYEALIMYNGSQTGPDPSNYLPVLSTCVPGPASASCQALYGSGSTLYDPSTQSYTFPIVQNARFYDPNTKASWPVYPSDVFFSIARTLAFGNIPGFGSHNGWIIAQSLLPAGNPLWDGGIHAPVNNTPQAIAASMTVNGTDCTAAILKDSNGCITFHVNGEGLTWPYFLELIADQLGGSVVSCGWVSAMGSTEGSAPIPGWTGTANDQPCLLPGGAHSTNDASFTTWLAAQAPESWDGYEATGAGPASLGNVISQMVGTGPFYLSGYSIGQSYALASSPAYQPNPFCTWQNCMPAANTQSSKHYPQKVEVTWETDISEGEQALAAGVADTAGIPATDTALELQLIQQGKVNALSFPSISIYFFPYDLSFNLALAQHYTTNPITVPPDWFTSVGMRNFFTDAYPYSTIESTVLTVDGIQTGFEYGGAIPQFMANYYPTNVSWPSQDPAQACAADASGPNCASWWWTQLTTPSSPYYDPEAAKCTTSAPCQLPLVGETGSPPLDQQENLWVNSINALSGGKLKVVYTDINFGQLVTNSLFAAPYQNSMPFYTLGWAPDYPDPTDYVNPLFIPNSTYTYGDAVAEQLSSLNSSSCDQNLWDYSNGKASVTQACQGAAYNLMTNALTVAAVTPAGPYRVLLYNAAEHIAKELALYTYQYQSNQQFVMSSWVSISSINTNVTTGGGGDFIWWGLSGNGVWGS